MLQLDGIDHLNYFLEMRTMESQLIFGLLAASLEKCVMVNPFFQVTRKSTNCTAFKKFLGSSPELNKNYLERIHDL